MKSYVSDIREPCRFTWKGPRSNSWSCAYCVALRMSSADGGGSWRRRRAAIHRRMAAGPIRAFLSFYLLTWVLPDRRRVFDLRVHHRAEQKNEA